jgi:hypothetical protein
MRTVIKKQYKLYTLEEIKNVNSTLLNWFIDYEDLGLLLILEGKLTGLRTVLHYLYVDENQYKLIKIDKAIPNGNPPKVKLVTTFI